MKTGVIADGPLVCAGPVDRQLPLPSDYGTLGT